MEEPQYHQQRHANEDTTASAAEARHELHAIRLGILAAEANDRQIDDYTASRIAGRLHRGRASALFALAVSGAVDEPRLYTEIVQAADGQENPEVQEWLNWLGAYCIRREQKGPIDGWHAPAERLPQREGHMAPDTEGDSRSESTTVPQPIEIWVGSLTHYNHGRLHGVWIDATLELEDLHEAVQHMLRASYYPDAREWAIFGHSGFGDLHLDEQESLETVSRLAKAIELHGPAYAAWAQYVGIHNRELLNAFEDHFLGEYDSLQAYVTQFLEQAGLRRMLDAIFDLVPAQLRPYVDLDVAAMARHWEVALRVEELPDGRVRIFER